MEAAILDWLSDVSVRAFGVSLIALLGIDLLFAAVILVRRDRELVNRWTSRVLAANLVLVGTGIGVPALAGGSRIAVRIVAPLIRAGLPAPVVDELEASPVSSESQPPVS